MSGDDRSRMVDRAIALGWSASDLYDPADYAINWATHVPASVIEERRNPSPPRVPLPEHLRVVTFKESRY